MSWNAAPRVLVVEANHDHRDLMAFALQSRGYTVDTCDNADDALLKLKSYRYALVIAHHGLPGRSGTELLDTAGQEGLLDETKGLIVTGQTRRPSTSVPVLHKPLDPDKLVTEVAALIGESEGPGPSRETESRPAAAKVHLVLYVTRPWGSSGKAQSDLEAMLKLFPPGDVFLEVHDLAAEPERAERDKVLFSPTLVKVWPEPKAWLIGDLRAHESLFVNVLALAGVTAME